MIKLSINNKNITSNDVKTVLDIAKEHDIIIPQMCNNPEAGHFTSCMVCVVKDNNSGELIPSCTAKIKDGMNITTDSSEVIESRKLALELLLSEHVGDCEAPCRIACPAFMNIPEMNRLIQQKEMEKALNIVREEIIFPGVLGRICSAPCEKACKRKNYDRPVAICLLKRFSFDYFLNKSESVLPENNDVTFKQKVAVIGAGPAGLSAAFFLGQSGINTEIFDKNNKPGGELQFSIPDNVLDKTILDKEIDIILNTGIKMHLNSNIDNTKFLELQEKYDAVVIATGNFSRDLQNWHIKNDDKQISINKRTYQTEFKNVFAVGSANRHVKSAVRSAAQGKNAAEIIKNFFITGQVKENPKKFNSTIGKLSENEYDEYLKESQNKASNSKFSSHADGFNFTQAKSEAERCMNCDCSKLNSCKLRDYSGYYKINKKRFVYNEREQVKKIVGNNNLVFEKGKCIKCGICVRITAKHQVEPGFTYLGRGFDTVITIAFNQKIDEIDAKYVSLFAESCPTGALSIKRRYNI